MMKPTKKHALTAGASLAALIAVLGASPALAQSSQAPAPNQNPGDVNATQEAQDPQAAEAQDVVVTGFRGSLEKALNVKRNESAAVDSILAEDIGKFPDLNLSESIQRIPGIALLRDGGEGRSISVRGLGPQFTRVRINGIEAIATAGGSDPSGGTNRGRGFDFNVFASDLFNAITVRKTAQAETEEGSLGATVDLRTARPFDYSNPFTIAASAQGSYNDLGKDTTPRGAFMVSSHTDTIGALFSVAYTKRKLIEEGYSTVRWAPNFIAASGTTAAVTNFTPGFESVNGTTCVPVGAGGASGTAVTPAPAVCTEANAAFHPRFPRYDYFIDDQQRLGVTGSIQWKPSPDTTVSLDGLYADFKATREERYLEAPSFSVSGGCTAASRATNCGLADTDVLSERIVNGVLVAGTFNDVDLRVENRFDRLDTKFKQATLEVSQKLGDTLSMELLGGYSSSFHNNPIQNTITFDQYNVDGYSYDYGTPDGRVPTFNFGTANLGSSTGWVLSQIRLRAATAKNTYKTISGNLSWKPAEGFEVVAGAGYKEYRFSTTFLQRSNGTTSSQDTNVSCCSADPLANYGRLVTINGVTFFDADYKAAESYFNLTSPTARGGAFRLGPEPGLSSNNAVAENDSSAFLQFNFNRPLGSTTLRGDFGVRYVKTGQDATGFAFLNNATVPVTVGRSYEDWLPAANVVLEITPDLLIRAAAARVMARPDLGSLAPGVSVSVSGANRTVSSGNPLLDPYRANTYDASIEYYWSRGALISVALFQKDIQSFVQTLTSSGVFSANPFGLPDSVAIAACGTAYPATCNPAFPNWTFSGASNTPGGRLRGYEINVQQPFRFLPGFLGNTGVLLNYTHVTSRIGYLNGAGVVVATANLTGLSPDSANATLYYEDKFLSARVSGAYRSDYLTRVPGQQGATVEGTKGTFNLDASVQLTLTRQIKLTFEGINLTDQYQDQYVDDRELESVYHHTGREFLFGVRFNY